VEILPLKGLSELQFGDSKKDLVSKFGSPTSIDNKGGTNVCYSEIYKYASLGLDVYLDIDAKFVVWGFSVNSKEFTLKGLSPIGMSESELSRSYPELVVEVTDGRFREYVNEELGLLFFLRDGIVARIDINPNLDDYIEALNETEN